MLHNCLFLLHFLCMPFQAEAEQEIQQLKSRCVKLELVSNSSMVHTDETMSQTVDELDLVTEESIYLVGGYDGETWLSALDIYSPSHNVIKSLQPMNSARSYASVTKLNGELYVFGGGTGTVWYDTGIACLSSLLLDVSNLCNG